MRRSIVIVLLVLAAAVLVLLLRQQSGDSPASDHDGAAANADPEPRGPQAPGDVAPREAKRTTEPAPEVLPDGTISGRVESASGEPIAGVFVLISARSTQAPSRVDCAPDGSFTTPPLASAAYTLVAWQGSLVSAPLVGVLVAPGHSARDLVLRLEEAASLVLTVRDAADGSSLRACAVEGGGAPHPQDW